MHNNKDLIYSGASPKEVAKDLKPLMDFKDDGISLDELNAIIQEKLIPHLVKYNKPEFHSLYNFFPEEGADFGAKIALKYNQGVTNWIVSPGAVMVEELCCRSLCRIFGLHTGSDATFMYCGTYANQEALYLALHRKAEQYGFNLSEKGLTGFPDPGRLAVLTSVDAHFSLKHAIRMLGLGDNSLITIPVDKNRRMDVTAFNDIMNKLEKTKDIFCVVATAGTTSTGSVDPVEPLIPVCQEKNAWLHIDAAFGFAYLLLPEKKKLFKGIEHADSICWDPHKQFGVPIPNSVLFVREKEDFKRMAIYGHYFNREDDPEPNPGLKSPPSTRPFSALPLVTSIRYQGMKKVKERLRAPLNAIASLYEYLKNEDDIEVCHEPDFGLLCIRILPNNFPENQLDRLQQHIYEKIKTEGKRSVSMTRLGNKTVLRLVALSPSVTFEALKDTILYIRLIVKEYDY